MTNCVFSDNSCKCDELTIIQEKKYSLGQKLYSFHNKWLWIYKDEKMKNNTGSKSLLQ